MSRLALKLLEVGFAAVFLKDPPAAAEYARIVGDHAALDISRVFAEARTLARAVTPSRHAHVVAGQVQHLASQPPVFLDLRL
jgi:hypothetical protein